MTTFEIMFLSLIVCIILLNSVIYYRWFDGRCRILPAIVLATLGGVFMGMFAPISESTAFGWILFQEVIWFIIFTFIPLVVGYCTNIFLN